MAEIDFGRLSYLLILVLVIGGYLFSQNRHRLGQTLQQAVLWLFIFLMVIIVYGFKDDLRQQLFPRAAVQVEGGRLTIQRAADDHFYTVVTINGVEVNFLVDTGATSIVLSRKDAAKIGIDLENLMFTGVASTANGQVRTALVKLKEVRLGPYLDRNLRAWVNDGALDVSLLGMDYLRLFSSIEITGDTLYLTR